MRMYTAAIDAMGGDNAPEEIVKGALRALDVKKDLRVLLCGPEERMRELTASAGPLADRIEIIDAPEIITMDEAPMMAVRRKKDSSMVQAALAVREGRADAMVSAGSTGAVLACGLTRIGRIQGIERPALAPVLPGIEKDFLLIDSGANVDCQSAYLESFGLMGAAYMKSVRGVGDPRVKLINIGAEEEKGNKLTREAFERMSAQTVYKFCGNVEARDIFTGDHDVIVADGFDGNLILKHTEGLAKAMFKMMKQEMTNSSLPVKLGAALVKPALYKLKDKMDYNKVGGAPLLGVNGAVVKAHGSSGAEAFASAVLQAYDMLTGDVVGKIKAGLEGTAL